MTPGPIPPLALDPEQVRDLASTVRVVRVLLRVRFRGLTEREVALVRGPAGWAEFGPFLEYGPGEARAWLAATVEAAYAGWPAPVRDRVAVNATVPAVAAEAVAGVLARFPGATTAKVKVAEPGQELRDDIARVAAVRDVLGPAGRIRVDANMGWDVRQAREALGALAAYGLEYAEQPCPSVTDLAELRTSLARAGIDVPIAADESIRKASDPLLVARAGAADFVVVKVAPLGGVRRALAIVAECGLPAVVSSALDTSVGMAGGLALAACLPELDHACGLGTVRLLSGDVVANPVAPVDGWLDVARHLAGGMGPVADPELVARWRAPEREDWWRERMLECAAL
jgi:O-succinylbenzoate synthase